MVKKSLLAAIACLYVAVPSHAEVVNAPSNPAAPDPVATSQTSGLPAEITTVGSLPESTQWLYDRTSSFLYLSYNTVDLKSQTLSFSHFKTDLGTTSFTYFAVDSFTRLFNLASPEGTSAFRKFAIWGEASLGMGSHDGDLYNTKTAAPLGAESSTIMTFFGKLGLQLAYDEFKWVKPYIGISSTWYSYRHNSSLSDAVAESGSSYYGPTLGVHVPLTFIDKVAVYGELQKIYTQKGGGQIFADGSNVNGGVGFSF